MARLSHSTRFARGRRKGKCTHKRLLWGKQFLLAMPHAGNIMLEENGARFLEAMVCADCLNFWFS